LRNAVLGALDPWNIGTEQRLELAIVEVLPGSPSAVVGRTRLTAFGAQLSNVCRDGEHHVHLLGLGVVLDVDDLSGSLKAEDRCVEVFVAHGAILPTSTIELLPTTNDARGAGARLPPPRFSPPTHTNS
jgi:hypothetical protein